MEKPESAAMNPMPAEEYGECTECGRVGTFAVISDAFSLCGACALKPADHTGDANDMIPAADVAAMREALKPFADCCDQIRDDEPDDEWAKFRLTVADYRSAKAALAALPEEPSA